MKTAATANINQPEVSVILVNYNTRDLTDRCITDLKKKSGMVSTEIILVDNASADGSVEFLEKKHPDIRLIKSSENLGFAGGNNLGIREATGRYILLLNTDAFIFDDTLDLSIRYMDNHPKTGLLGVQLLSEEGFYQPSARYKPSVFRKLMVLSGMDRRISGKNWSFGYDYPPSVLKSPIDVDWVPGAFLLIRREVIESIGLLDDRYFMYFEEVDYCLQAAKAGWKTTFFPAAAAIHLGGASSKQTRGTISRSGSQLISIRVASELRFYSFWYGKLMAVLNLATEGVFRWLVALKHRLMPRVGSNEIIESEQYTSKVIVQQLWLQLRPVSK